MEQFRAYKPFVKPFMKPFAGVLKKRIAKVAPQFIQPKQIIPVKEMVNVISEEEQAENQQPLMIQSQIQN